MSERLETWLPAPRFPDYLVSDLGRVMRATGGGNNFVKPGRILKPQIQTNGYARVNLFGPEGMKPVSVHVLVCEAFHGPKPTAAHEVAHADGTKANNRPDNLRWATRSENHADKRLHGTQQSGERNGNSRLTAEIVAAMRADPRSLKEVAEAYGVNYTYAWSIIHRRVWKDAA